MEANRQTKKLTPVILAGAAFLTFFVIGAFVSLSTQSNVQGYNDRMDELVKAGKHDWDGLFRMAFSGLFYGGVGGGITWGVSALALSGSKESEED